MKPTGMPKAFPVTKRMKIILTGGGTGGHFYPIIAVAQSLNKLSKERHTLEPKLFYLAPSPYNKGMLFDNKIEFRSIPAGKLRRYFSLLNFTDVFKTIWGIIKSIWIVFNIYPDVVFGKGGYGSFPVLFAARILRIPVIIHETDAVAGRTNIWAGKFAKRISISFPESARFFPKEKTAYTGSPVREEIKELIKEGGKEFLNLEDDLPVILIMGGSQGSQIINDVIIESLETLLKKYQIIHQTGKKNLSEVKSRVETFLFQSKLASRYHPFDYLNDEALRMSAGASDLIISRAGSLIFEIAAWAKPSIIIPITNSNGNHQRKNAYAYAKSGACYVIEESNLTDNILISEIERILNNPEEKIKMSESAEKFFKKDSAEVIAEEIIKLTSEHSR